MAEIGRLSQLQWQNWVVYDVRPLLNLSIYGSVLTNLLWLSIQGFDGN